MKPIGIVLIFITSITVFILFVNHRTKKHPSKKAHFKRIITHEVNPKMVAIMNQTIVKLEQLQKQYSNFQNTKQLKNWLTEVTELKKQYVRVSPALAALGPIGTTSIVLKEEKIEKRLNELVQEINTFLGEE